MSEQPTMKGTVESYCAAEGFGYILGPDDKLYFVHEFNIESEEDEPKLEKGQAVAFDPAPEFDGAVALNVRVAAKPGA